MPPFEIKGGIGHNMAGGATAKLDAGAALNEGRHLADGVAPKLDAVPK